MNNWLKVGVPVLVAVLLVVSAVGITIAVTRGDTANQVAVSSLPGIVPDTGAAKAAACQNCPGYGQTTAGDQGTAANPVYIPQGKQASCCATSSQGSTTSQTYRGGCCGAR